jgi:glutaminyl-tRNA synthetase
MRAGEFPDGARTLRAKIDMASPNLNMRDPVMYRILHAEHHRTGDKWCIYPMYDFAHGQSDSIERITHSICTLEFEDHRPLYDWYVEQLGIYHPQQIEFDRLNLTYTLLSKRKLLQLVQEGTSRLGRSAHADDFRHPPPRLHARSMRNFCAPSACRRPTAPSTGPAGALRARGSEQARAARDGVLRPLRVVIDNYPEGQVEEMEAVNNPEDASAWARARCRSRACSTSSRTISAKIRRSSISASRRGAKCACATATSSLHRRGEGRKTGEVVEIHCTYDPATRGGNAPDGRKVKSTIHWVSAAHAIDAEVRCTTICSPARIPTRPRRPGFHRESESALARSSDRNCKLEPSLARAVGGRYQFERLGYFCVDPDSAPGKPVFNRTVALRDTWAKIEKAKGGKGGQKP